jgi:hypothetical protein
MDNGDLLVLVFALLNVMSLVKIVIHQVVTVLDIAKVISEEISVILARTDFGVLIVI